MARERDAIAAAITAIELEARAAGKASAERPALGRRAGAVVIRAQADACAAQAAAFSSVAAVSQALNAAAVGLRQRADAIDPPGQ